MDVTVDGTDFCVYEDHVSEYGTNLRYDPATGEGYQVANGRRVALTSYEAFGSDLNRASELAKRWCEKAQNAWDTVA